MSTVSLIRATSYDRAALRSSVETVLEPLGGMAAFVKPGDRVLLKPNLLTGSRPTKECVTRKEIVACVAEMVKEVGGKPFLGDSPAFGSARGVAKVNGYLPIAKALELPIVEFKSKVFTTENPHFRQLRLSKQALDADVVINLPKIKSHCQLTLTMAVKNLFGCVPGKVKAWWHMEAGKDPDRFAQMLVETAKAIAPNLTLVDGIIAHEGNGPSGGEPRDLGVLAASTNVFALDRAIVEILNTNPEWVPTLVASQRLGVCPKLEEIDFPLQRPVDLQVTDWKLPEALVPIDFGLPRVVKSTFKHLIVRWVREPLG